MIQHNKRAANRNSFLAGDVEVELIQQLLENTVISKIVIANENMGFEIKLK